MEPIEVLRRSRDEFERRLALVADDQWELPTPCGDWNVRELVNHVLLGTRMSADLLEGQSQHDAIAGLGDDLMADSADPGADFTALADRMVAGFEAGLDGTVNHPMGEIPRQMFIGFRIGDNAVHA